MKARLSSLARDLLLFQEALHRKVTGRRRQTILRIWKDQSLDLPSSSLVHQCTSLTDTLAIGPRDLRVFEAVRNRMESRKSSKLSGLGYILHRVDC